MLLRLVSGLLRAHGISLSPLYPSYQLIYKARQIEVASNSRQAPYLTSTLFFPTAQLLQGQEAILGLRRRNYVVTTTCSATGSTTMIRKLVFLRHCAISASLSLTHVLSDIGYFD